MNSLWVETKRPNLHRVAVLQGSVVAAATAAIVVNAVLWRRFSTDSLAEGVTHAETRSQLWGQVFRSQEELPVPIVQVQVFVQMVDLRYLSVELRHRTNPQFGL